MCDPRGRGRTALSAEADVGRFERPRRHWIGRVLDLAAGVPILGLGVVVSAGFTVGLVTGAFNGGVAGPTFPGNVVVAVAFLAVTLALGSQLGFVGLGRQRG
jgi:hypothetical protein